MVTKYFKPTGEIAFRLFTYALVVNHLIEHPNSEKTENLRNEMMTFMSSAENLTEADKRYLNELIQITNELPAE